MPIASTVYKTIDGDSGKAPLVQTEPASIIRQMI